MQDAPADVRIRAAMVDLLAEQPFSKITITMVCQRAHVSRSSYYYHYYDPLDVVDDIVGRVMQEFDDVNHRLTFEESISRTVLAASLEQTTTVLGRHSTELAAILGSDVSSRFEQPLRSYVTGGIRSAPFVSTAARRYGGMLPEIEYAAYYEVVRAWILGGCSQPQDEVVALLTEFCMAMLGNTEGV